jgi:hypothetical protein
MDAYMQNDPLHAIFEAYPPYIDCIKIPNRLSFKNDV